ncbi:YMGG-like glycine zipper-containing protein [Desulfovibrio sp. OttesenSCG-928-F20]|nr:YMGG-like glycine zipper-containing protein [Desulfovibrio sp. OttesenSCG-928-M16]MDL2290645.1 YMGG-like glycine zipper-containing protein [Desulfovibrio sp. OttesenSCG-928-F20]
MKERSATINLCILALILTLALPGCATIQNDATRTKTEGTLVGAAGGAGIGAAIGAIFGGSRGAGIGAAIGAVVGAGAGYLVGDHIARKKAEYATQEEWLDACVAHARQVNTSAAQYNSKIKTEIAALDRKSTQLAADYKINKASREALLAETEAVEKRQKELDKNIDNLQAEVKEQTGVAQDARANNKLAEAKALEAEIAETRKQITEMENCKKEFANISVRMAV